MIFNGVKKAIPISWILLSNNRVFLLFVFYLSTDSTRGVSPGGLLHHSSSSMGHSLPVGLVSCSLQRRTQYYWLPPNALVTGLLSAGLVRSRPPDDNHCHVPRVSSILSKNVRGE